MRGSWRIGRVMGIDLMVDLSWFLIVALMIYSLGFIEFPRELHPGMRPARADAVSITLGIVVSLMLFASVLAHELAHSWMALECGIAVKRITLFIFGGVAQIAEEPDRPRAEFLIAVMGPLMSLMLAALFGAAWVWLTVLDSTQALGAGLKPLVILLATLTQANGSLALFNLAPGFPLDGGRVLRAILWARFRDIRRATLWATRAGQGIALLFVLSGAAQFFFGLGGSGIWLGLIGIFLWNAARDGYRQTLTLATLRGVTVAQLMTREISVVAPELSLAEFIDAHLLPRREQTFVVCAGETPIGIIALEHLKRFKRSTWQTRLVRDAMLPLFALPILTPEHNAATALARLNLANQSELPVIVEGQVVGFLGEEELFRFLKLQ